MAIVPFVSPTIKRLADIVPTPQPDYTEARQRFREAEGSIVPFASPPVETEEERNIRLRREFEARGLPAVSPLPVGAPLKDINDALEAILRSRGDEEAIRQRQAQARAGLLHVPTRTDIFLTEEQVQRLPRPLQPFGTAVREMTSPLSLAGVGLTAGLGPGVAAGVRGGTGAVRILRSAAASALEPVVGGGFGARFGAETALGLGATTAAEETRRHVEGAPPIVRFGAPLAAGLVGGAATLAGIRRAGPLASEVREATRTRVAFAHEPPKPVITSRDFDEEIARLERLLKRAKTDEERAHLQGDISSLRELRQISIESELSQKDVKAYRKALENLYSAELELDAAQHQYGGPAPKFGTRERAEWDLERKLMKEAGHRLPMNKAEAVARATNLVRRWSREVRYYEDKADQKILGISKRRPAKEAEAAQVVQQPPATAPQPEVAAPQPQPQVGVMQAGMGIGEQPPQGMLFENLPAEGGRVPLASPESLAAAQARREAVAAGQQALPEAATQPVDLLASARRIGLEAIPEPGSPNYRRWWAQLSEAEQKAQLQRLGLEAPPVTPPTPQPAAPLATTRAAVEAPLPEGRPPEATAPQPIEPPQKPPVAREPAPPTGPSAAEPPPVPPTTAQPPASGLPEVPGVPFHGVEAALARADAIIERDAEGAIGRLLSSLPGIRHLRRFEQPRVNLTRQQLRAFIAAGDVRARMATDAFATRVQVLRKLADAFGEEAVRGGKVAGVRFIGAPEQASRINNTLLDIAQRTRLYELTPQQHDALRLLDAHTSRMRAIAAEAYGVGVGEFKQELGEAWLPTRDVSEGALEMAGGEPYRVAASGRAKPRLWDNAAERLAYAEKTGREFTPDLDVARLLGGADEELARLAGAKVFFDNIGRKTRLEVMQETHPELYKAMMGLRRRLANLSALARKLEQKQADAIDAFLASEHEAEDLTALEAGLVPTVTKGAHKGKDIQALNAEIEAVREEIAALRPRWEGAYLKPYVRFEEARGYFKAEELTAEFKQLFQVSRSGFLDFMENWRATVLGADFSPLVGVQTPLGFLFDPYGTSRQWVGGIRRAARERDILRAFRMEALAEDIRQNPQSWLDFASYLGRPVQAGTPAEFAGGWLRKIPGYSRANDALYIAVMRQQKRLYDTLASSRLLADLPEEMRKAVAADQVAKVYPTLHPRALGQGPAREKLIRSMATSVSFVRQPISLTLDATRGFAKLGVGQPLTGKERLAVRLMTTLAASAMSASIASAIIDAKRRNGDVMNAVKRVADPRSGTFASVIIGTRSVPLGGPYRALFKALAPREVEGSPVPVPFAGMVDYARARLTPSIRTQIELLRDRDFFGNRIMYGKFPENILRGVLYEMEMLLPLTAGAVAEAVRTGQTTQAASQAIGQFAGVNVGERTPYQVRDMAVEAWAKQQGIKATRYSDLSPAQRRAFDEAHPELRQATIEETRRRAELGQPWALGQRAYDEAEARRLRDENQLAEMFEAGMLTPDEFRDRYANIQLESATAKRQVNADFQRFQETGRMPDDPNKAALVGWYNLYDAARQPGGLNFEELESLQQAFLEGLTPEQRRYVEQNTGVAEHPPLIKEYLEAKKLLEAYWNAASTLPDASWVTPVHRDMWALYQQSSPAVRQHMEQAVPHIKQCLAWRDIVRERMRLQRPEIDAALVRWYGYKPIRRTAQPIGAGVK